MNDSWLIVLLVVFVIAIAALTTLVIKEIVRMNRLEAAQPMYAKLRKSISSRINSALATSSRYELADPSSGKTLEAIADTTGLEGLFAPRPREIRIYEHRPSSGSRPAQTLTTIYRLPPRVVVIRKIILIEDTLTTKAQRKEMLRQAWRHPESVSIEELVELERALTHWRSTETKKWSSRPYRNR